MKSIKRLIILIIKNIFKLSYHLNIEGLEHFPKTQGVLLLGNHSSWIDWIILHIASPRPLHFVIAKNIYQKWYLKPFLAAFGVIPISQSASKAALARISTLLQAGEVVCLFPEGGISRTGQLASFKKDYEYAIAEVENAKIIPFHLQGLWGSRFSPCSDLLRKNSSRGGRRSLFIAFGAALSQCSSAAVVKQKVFELSTLTWRRYAENMNPISYDWLVSAKKRGRAMTVAEVSGKELSHYRFMTAVFRFAAKIRQLSPEQNIGLLLPTTSAGAIVNMSVLSLGKTLVNLNYTASREALQAAVKQADIQTIYTSSQFLIKLKARGIDAADIFAGTRLIFLEELKKDISALQLLTTLLGCIFFPTKLLQYCYLTPVKQDDTAAILFSSGSESVPKGIELSHRNLNTNTRQIADMLNTQSDDVMLSNLPIFHAFGLVATTLMPLREGIPMVCHPDPTDVVNIAKGVSRYNATLLIGTSTFFRLYTLNRKVHPAMLDSLRLVIAGAEKLRTDVQDAFVLKFNKTIHEGYGATETSPAVSVNIPDLLDNRDWSIQTCQKKGSVGLPFPGTCLRIVDPESLQPLALGEEGLILIGGQQVMKGYLKAAEKTASVISVIDGIRWYHTGDKGYLDAQGFLSIVDRYSRFAKIGGEMISLTAVEEQVRAALSQNELNVLALAVADHKKGEKIILLVTEDLALQQLRDALINAKVNPLMHPSQCILVDEIPTLGTGKTDFSAAKRLLALKYSS